MSIELIHALILLGVLGIGAQWLAWRLRVPSIVLLMAAGLIAGPALGVIRPHAQFGELLHPLVSLFVAVILFEGGLNLRLHELRHAGTGVVRLVALGVPLTWGLTAVAARALGGLEWPVALLFAAITVVTGPTVILPLLRQARLRKRPASYLRWEGIINDPAGALLAVLVFEFFAHGDQLSDLGLNLGLALAASAALGWGGARGIAHAFSGGAVPEFLKPPVLLVAVAGVYGAANAVQAEAGLLAVTVMGMVLGNQRLAGLEELRRFKEYITVLLVSGVFILLTADLDPDLLASLDWRSVLLVAAVIFAVRPLAVWLATLGTGMDWRERALLGWIAPRGIVAAAVAGFFGPRMVEAGYPQGEQLLPLVFVLILATVLLHGLSIRWLARRLGLAAARGNGVLVIGASPWGQELARTLHELEVPVLLADTSWNRLRQARIAGIPVYFGEILSEAGDERLDIYEMSQLVALTPNDAYNALVCSHMANELGRTNVYQLPSHRTEGDEEGRELSYTLRGLPLLGEDYVFEALQRRHYQGWSFHRTRLTESYTYEDHLRDRTGETVDVLLLHTDGTVEFKMAEQPLEPSPGDLLVTFRESKPVHREDANTEGSPTAQN
jgi:NhaP-type Na+/H+ or K+/H+ antiporter